MANKRSGGIQLHTKVDPELRHKIDTQLDQAAIYAATDCPRTLQDFVVQALYHFLPYNLKQLEAVRQQRSQPPMYETQERPQVKLSPKSILADDHT